MNSSFGILISIAFCLFDLTSVNSCPQESFSYEGMCIWNTNTEETESESSVSCQQHQGELILIDNREILEFILSIVDKLRHHSPKAKFFWINRMSGFKEMEVRKNIEFVSDHRQCFAIDAKGTDASWKLSDCNDLLYGICYKLSEEYRLKLNFPRRKILGTTNCQSNGLYLSTYGLCYWTYGGKKKGSDAQAACVSEGGSLAVFLNEYIFNGVKSGYQSNLRDAESAYGSSGVWIGYNDMDNENVFITFDGEPATYLNWKPGQPNDLYQSSNQDCVALFSYNNFYWEDKSCNEWRVPFCYKEDSVTTTTPSPTTHEETTTTPPATTHEEITTTPHATTHLETTAERSTAEPTTTTSTTPEPTTTSAATSTTSVCLISVCYCADPPVNSSDLSFTASLDTLRQDTAVSYKNTSAYKRSLISVYETRSVPRFMGLTAGAIIVSVFLCLAFCDAVRFAQNW